MYGPASVQDVRTLLRFSVPMPALTSILCLMWGSVLDDPTPAIVLSMVLAILVGSFLPMGAIASEDACGWRTFLVSAGVPRKRIVAMRFATTSVLPSILLGVLCCLALAVAGHPDSAIPASVCSASCCLMMSSSSIASKFDGKNGLSVPWVIVSTASLIIVVIMMMAATGSELESASVLGSVTGILVLIADLAISMHSFSRMDL